MTNEQAKSELMQIYGMLSEEKKQALDVLMAQADGKYINIQDAISEIREMAKWHTGDAFNADRVIQHLKQLSSVAIPSAEPKTGHWIENAPEYQNIDPPYICSECGNFHLRKTNYCDQCGAKMVDEQERRRNDRSF